MSRWVPFTAHVQVIPERGSRTTHVRSLQKISSNVYDAFISDAGLTDYRFAEPGGGQHQSYGPQMGGIGGMAAGFAVKPQFGQTPAQLMIHGFISSDTENVTPVPDKTVIHAGETMTGYGGNHHWNSLPKSGTDDLAEQIYDDFTTALTSELGSRAVAGWKIFRVEVAGVVYGDRGFHFPN